MIFSLNFTFLYFKHLDWLKILCIQSDYLKIYAKIFIGWDPGMVWLRFAYNWQKIDNATVHDKNLVLII